VTCRKPGSRRDGDVPGGQFPLISAGSRAGSKLAPAEAKETTMRVAVLSAGLLVSAVALAGCNQAPVAEAPAQSAAPATQAAAAPSSEDVQNTVSQLEHEWVDAIVKKDVATLQKVIADDFVGVSSSGGSYTKSLAIQDVQNGQYVVEKMELTEVAVTPFGPNTAVAFTTQDEASHYGITNTSGRYRYMDVWMLRNGQWQVVASHGAKAE
jgi:hypothetical protein